MRGGSLTLTGSAGPTVLARLQSLPVLWFRGRCGRVSLTGQCKREPIHAVTVYLARPPARHDRHRNSGARAPAVILGNL